MIEIVIICFSTGLDIVNASETEGVSPVRAPTPEWGS